MFQPNISVSSSMYGVSGAQQQGFQVFRGSSFTISCSIQPQYPGGSFQLNFTSINSANNYYSEPAVNHSAHFLFPAAEPAHQGSYSCVYHVSAFSQDFSESRLLSVTVTDPEPFIIRAVVLPLTQLLPPGGGGRADRRTLSWIMMTWVFLLKRKELREQSSSSKELLSHTWVYQLL
ncbi:hypothetical protein F7725_017697 [Dissostichus mawsoni]|uniref:Ig-like domain-containing protein n=1 Tax=Dissostichus mawsoni TaxID=36200 RepID=A0A7J5XPN2_DISMA|nr:hypothetical protein F7725_017697 [Dissostichus mawsoni]